MTELSPFSDLIPAKRRQDDNPFADLIPAAESPPSKEGLFVERSGITTALEVAPAMAGGVLGLPLGPVGVIGGGALGAAAGRGLSNLAKEIESQIRQGKLVSGIAEELEDIATGHSNKLVRGATRQSLDMLQAGTTDLAFGTGFSALGRLGSKGLTYAGRLSGAQSPEVRQIIQEARDGNLSIGAIELDKPFFSSAGRVAGVIPIIGGPIRKEAGGKAIKASNEFTHILDDISPPVDLSKLGVDFTKAGKRTLDARRTLANARYDRMHETLGNISELLTSAGESPVVVPTKNLRQKAAELIGQGDTLPTTAEGRVVGIPLSSDREFTQALSGFTDLPEFITPQQLEALQKNLNRAARGRSGNQMSANEFRIINNLNSATWDDLSQINLPPNVADDAIQSIQKAKQAWVDLKSLEETAAAGKFKRADRNFFGAGFEKIGSAEIDEIADMFVSSQSSLRSPEFIQGLEDLVGVKNRKALARAIIERAANPTEAVARATVDQAGATRGGTTDIVTFSASQMRQRLGLTVPRQLGPGASRRNREALKRLLSGSGVSAERLDSFLRSVERIQGSPVGDPSTFLGRRIVLGGALFGAGAVGAGAVGALGPVGVGAFVLTARQFSKLISSPGGLKLLREGYEPNLTRQQLLNLTRRISAFFPNDEAEIR